MNSSGFLLAALKEEGLVQPMKNKQRCYEKLDPKEWLAEFKALMASATDLKAKDKSVTAKPKQAIAKKSAGKSGAKKKA